MVKRILLLLTIVILLASCSASKRAQNKVSRAHTLLEQAKQLDPSISVNRIDTVEVPVIVEKSTIDSVFTSIPGDTVVIENEKLKIKYVKLPGDSVFIAGEVKTDTVYVKVPVEKETFIKRESYRDIVKRVFGLNNFGFYTLHVVVVIVILGALYLKFKPF